MKKTALCFIAIVLLCSCTNLRSNELPTANSNLQTPAMADLTPDKKEFGLSHQNENNVFIQTKNKTVKWTPEEKTTFMTACVDGTTENMGEARSTNYCACLLNKLEKLYPVADEVINLPETKQIELSAECQQ